MTLFGLAGILVAGLLGPLLATPHRLRLPVVVGELLAGVLVGRTGAGWVNPDQPVLAFLASAGFALVMLVAGSHVPLRHDALRGTLRRGVLLAGAVGLLAVPASLGIARLTGTGHAPLYAVLLASSSAALVMPIIQGEGWDTPAVRVTIVQVAVADTVCIIALPLVAAPAHAKGAALGVLAVLVAGCAMWLVMRWLRAHRVLDWVRRLSIRRNFGLELRAELILLFALAGLAQWVGISVMLAGFVTGLVLAAQGEPRRLARQLFAVTDGFLAPVFYVWLGATLDLRALAGQPRMLVLAALLAGGTLAVHAAAGFLGQPVTLSVLAAAQLGVPVAAVTIATTGHLLTRGEDAAILAAALVTILAAGTAGALASRSQRRGSTLGPR
ncbi:cation:proton antiporter [Gandjariella thermophila]|uniref:Cation/H+ exchanger transmembrane domain-containing protein n=1 Tax=Gandjariella thermophila TaxID=1931992 RepID=A0A4D4JFM6_9PSEU|nr:cation:proton antiporter [Gandjariella thermophila]GDY33800.1 hypothetical protein GTS_54330 [Gandjariella thermophila]